jgi:hypothetical protein
MNPIKKLATWWRGPTDPDTLASEAENQREQARRQTIRISQNVTAKGTGGSLLSAPTPDLLEPGREDHHNPR